MSRFCTAHFRREIAADVGHTPGVGQPEDQLCEALQGADLHTIAFVRDHVQLRLYRKGEFRGPYDQDIAINLYVDPMVIRPSASLDAYALGWADAMRSLVSAEVVAAELIPGEAFTIVFDNGERLQTSLRPDDHPPSAAMEVVGAGREWEY